MIYVFDTSSFIVLGHYFPQRFPSFWEKFNNSVSEGKIISVREVFNELDVQASRDHLITWIRENKRIFLKPEQADETSFVSQIFSVTHFQQLVKEKQRLKGAYVADPFVIASAKVRDACVITEESKKDNAAKIPNVCEYFHINCSNLEGFMEREKWKF